MAENIPLRCTIPGEVTPPPSPPCKPGEDPPPAPIYPARFAKERNSFIDDQEFLGEGVSVNRQQLRLPINPNYTLGTDWLVKLSGETRWSKVALVRELFVSGRARFWIVTRELPSNQN